MSPNDRDLRKSLETLIWAIIIAIIIYVIFIICPSVCGAIIVFTRKTGRDVTGKNLKGTPYEAQADEVLSSIEYLRKCPSEKITATAPDGTELTGDYYAGGERGLVIMFHGYNVAPLLNYSVPGKMFLEAGYSLLLTDQRGHGRSGGKQTTMGIREKNDVCAWVDAVHAKKPEEKILLYGVSMGATTVGLAACQLSGDVSTIVYDSGYLSVYDEIYRELSKRYLPAMLMMPFVRLTAKLVYRIEIKENVRQSLCRNKIPMAFIHCLPDSTVPAEQGRKAYEACASEKIFLESPAEGHTVALLYNYCNERKKLLDFISAVNENSERRSNEKICNFS